MIQSLKQSRINLEKINEQRRIWLYASAAIVLGIVLIISGWHYLEGRELGWIIWSIVSTGLIVSVIWWYWTMRIIKHSLDHQSMVFDVLIEMTEDIQLVRKDVKNLIQPVDKTK